MLASTVASTGELLLKLLTILQQHSMCQCDCNKFDYHKCDYHQRQRNHQSCRSVTTTWTQELFRV